MVYFDDILEDSSVHSSITVEIPKSEQQEVPVVVRGPACPCLRFSLEHNAVKIIENNDDFSDEEKAAAYYSVKELREMKRQVRSIARWLVEHDLDSTGEPDFTIRGMESMVFADLHNAKKASRRLAAAAVFMEQEMQEGEGFGDAMAIAEEYIKITEESQRRAQTAGAKDALEARQ